MEERNEDLERIPGWLKHELVDKPTAHAGLVHPFLHWFLLRRATPTGMRRHPAPADRDLRRRVSVALDFLAWVDQRGLTLTDLAQEHTDDWIAGATSQRRYLIRYFLKGTTSRRLTRELTVPSIPSQEPQDLFDDDDRWRLRQRCLTDDALPTDVRAGARSPCCSVCPPNVFATWRLNTSSSVTSTPTWSWVVTPSCCLHGSPSSFGNLPNGPNCGRSSREPNQALGGSDVREQPVQRARARLPVFVAGLRSGVEVVGAGAVHPPPRQLVHDVRHPRRRWHPAFGEAVQPRVEGPYESGAVLGAARGAFQRCGETGRRRRRDPDRRARPLP
ncbi:hypothetical protein ACWGBX_13635 [Streptomyces sp. NPDC055037]